MNSEHLHDRPEWNCRVCEKAWPCDGAKAGLLAEYRAYPSLLRIYLSAEMYDALDDLSSDGEPPGNLHERFLSWVRHGPATP